MNFPRDYPPVPDRCAASAGVTIWLLDVADWAEERDMSLTAKVIRAYVERYVNLVQARSGVRGLRGEIPHRKIGVSPPTRESAGPLP